MKKIVLGLLAVMASAGAADGARAQVCAGFPTVDNQLSVGASALLPKGVDFGDIRGLEASYNGDGPLTGFGGVTTIELAGEENTYTAGLAFELTALGPRVSACPVGSFSYTRIQGSGDVITVPVGFGVGTSFGRAGGFQISPAVAPQIIFSWIDIPDRVGGSAGKIKNTDVGITGNLILSYSHFWVSGVVGHVFDSGADPTFGIRAGFRL